MPRGFPVYVAPTPYRGREGLYQDLATPILPVPLGRPRMEPRALTEDEIRAIRGLNSIVPSERRVRFRRDVGLARRLFEQLR